MATRIKEETSSTWRLRLGESVLTAAHAIDTSPVKARLEEFERAQQEYAGAHQNIEVAEAQLRAAETELIACQAVQDTAITALAGALIGEGQPVPTPFAVYGGPPFKMLKRMGIARKTDAVHQLVAVLQRDENIRDATKKAAEATDEAARALEQAFVPVKTMRKGVREARRTRDARSHAWDTALGCLRCDARTAARGGKPEIYAAFFPPRRPAMKSSKAAANPPPVPETPAEPTPTVTEPSKAA